MKSDHTSYINENNMVKILGIMITIYVIETRLKSSANRYFFLILWAQVAAAYC